MLIELSRLLLLRFVACRQWLAPGCCPSAPARFALRPPGRTDIAPANLRREGKGRRLLHLNGNVLFGLNGQPVVARKPARL